MGNILHFTNSRGEPIAVNKLKVTSVTKHSNSPVKVWSDDGSFVEVRGKYEDIVNSLGIFDDKQPNREQYKRDMMLQLVRNEALTEIIQRAYQNDTRDQFHSVIGELADKLTEEAFK